MQKLYPLEEDNILQDLLFTTKLDTHCMYIL